MKDMRHEERRQRWGSAKDTGTDDEPGDLLLGACICATAFVGSVFALWKLWGLLF